jgi:lipid-A-disaccharide synthase
VGKLGEVRAFGLGGLAMAGAGVELVGDLRHTTALGVGEAGARAGSVWWAWRTLLRATRARRPRAALLVNYTEFNTRLAAYLHGEGVRVLWYGAPQIWAWRPRRAVTLRRTIDRLAVMLPFEEALWRRQGVDAHYVGHPSLETTALERETARHALGMTPRAAAVAVLAGSRPHEVRRLLVPMLEAYERVRADRASVDARVIVAASLDVSTRAWVHDVCRARRVLAFEADAHVGAMGVLRAFDVSLCASGTASLEAAFAGAVPVVAYRVGLATELAARAFVRTPHIALPNVLLGRRAFTELVQRDVNAGRLASALAQAMDQRVNLLAACEELRALFGTATAPSAAVARMLAPWIEADTDAA